MNSTDKHYLKFGKASEIKDPAERRLYRLFEILPGACSWAILVLVFIASWLWPVFAVVFIILFDTYWFFKTLFYTLHAAHTFKILRQNLKINWLEKLKKLDSTQYTLPVSSWEEIYHLIVLPMSIEEYAVVRETFQSLEKANYPKDKMIVILPFEGRKSEHGRAVAEKIEKEFGQKFFRFLAVEHPDGIEGELKGKGANATWATREAKKNIVDPLNIPYENIVISNFDSDTSALSDYFACLTYNYLTAKNPLRCSYQPIPFFMNNILDAPAMARVVSFSATFFQLIQQSRPEKMATFSSHSMPFKSLVEVDYWQTNVVSEDSRIFWQCLLHFDGDWTVKSLFFPVNMDVNVERSFWQTMVNQYKQQRRWAYGAENIAYIFFGFSRTKKISFRRKFDYGFRIFEGACSWATNALVIFFLGWLPITLGGENFKLTLVSFNLPQITSRIMTASLIGMIAMLVINFWFLPRRAPKFTKWKYPLFLLQWILLPLNLILFGCFPALEAQTRLMLGKYMGFWVTPKHRKAPLVIVKKKDEGG